MKCEDCKYAKLLYTFMSNGNKIIVGAECHLKPPLQINCRLKTDSNYYFPRVEYDDFCGEFKPKET